MGYTKKKTQISQKESESPETSGLQELDGLVVLVGVQGGRRRVLSHTWQASIRVFCLIFRTQHISI